MSRTSCALALILDVSNEMTATASAIDGYETTSTSCLHKGKELMNTMVANMTREGYKKDLVGVYACGADNTENIEFNQYGGCQNVVTAYSINVCNREAFICVDSHEALQGVSSQLTCDLGNGLRVAKVEMENIVKSKKYKNRIVFFTNGRGITLDTLLRAKDEQEFSMSTHIDIVIIDCQDKDTNNQNHNTKQLRVNRLCELCSGTLSKCGFRILSGVEMHTELLQAHAGSIGQTASFKGVLHISPRICFHVQMFSKVITAKPPRLKGANKILLSSLSNASKNNPIFALVQRDARHVLYDNTDEQIDPNDEISGYRFGQQSIPFENHDMPLRIHPTIKGIVCLGFFDDTAVPLHLAMGRSCVIEAIPGLTQSIIGLSAFVRAMAKLRRALIARIVSRDNGKTRIAALFPSIAHDDEADCLYSFDLPFWDDYRAFEFDDFAQEKCKPTAYQVLEMGNFIDSMYIGDPKEVPMMKAENESQQEFQHRFSLLMERPEQFVPECTLNPFLERIYKAIEAKARDEHATVAHDTPDIERLFRPSPAVIASAETAARKVKAAFSIEKTADLNDEKRMRCGHQPDVAGKFGQPDMKYLKTDLCDSVSTTIMGKTVGLEEKSRSESDQVFTDI